LQVHSIAHGVVLLEQCAIDYGGERRRLRVIEMRGIRFRSGFHDFTIETGGLAIYPRLVAAVAAAAPIAGIRAKPAIRPPWASPTDSGAMWGFAIKTASGGPFFPHRVPSS
jgi:hypothetical protein